ncbi:MAG TPA: universal stress protein [Vicinamibacterales bacterium]
MLCPVDFSEQSRLALRYADAIARRGHGALTVLYVNGPFLIAAAGAALHDRHIAECSQRELQAFVTETVGRPSARTRTCLGGGQPSNEILRIAGRASADLLVIGTRGLTGADRLLLGSTALNVLRRTTVPVLAVPRPSDATAAPVPDFWPGQRIVAAVDLESQSPGNIEVEAALAHWFNASLLLLHVVSTVAAPAWLTGAVSAHERIRVSQAQQRLDRLATTARRRVATDVRVVGGAPADEIAAAAAAEQMALVVIALRDRHGWSGTKLNGLFVLIGLLGGVQAFGVSGLLLGPVLIGIAAALLTPRGSSERSERSWPTQQAM